MPLFFEPGAANASANAETHLPIVELPPHHLRYPRGPIPMLTSTGTNQVGGIFGHELALFLAKMFVVGA